MKTYQFQKTEVLILILVVYYLIGTIGILIKPDYFIPLTPVSLILTMILLLAGHKNLDAPGGFMLFIIFAASFSLEWVGVSTGLIFGKYSYGSTLGTKLGETPLLIGLNWIIVAYSSIASVQSAAKKLTVRLSQLQGALAAGLLMLILDFLIEPIAPKLDFWSWENNTIPVQNYTAWFFFGTAFCFWMLKGGILPDNKTGPAIYLTQILFFAALNLFL